MASTHSTATGPADRPTQGARLTLWHVSIALTVIGLLVSGYLSYVKLADVPMACSTDLGFDCGTVQASIYSEMFGIPIAWLGFATYVVIGALLLLQNRIPFLQENGLLLLFGVVLFAFIYSLYLIYVQGVLLQAWCQWCLMHELTISVLFVVTGIRLYNSLKTGA